MKAYLTLGLIFLLVWTEGSALLAFQPDREDKRIPSMESELNRPQTRPIAPTVPSTRPSEDAQTIGIGTQWVDGTGKLMTYIPPGSFIMGFNGGDYDNRPPHPVEITKPFWMDVTEVTADEYAACVEARVCKWPYKELEWPELPPSHQDLASIRSKSCGKGAHRRPGYPLNCINYAIARRYCEVWRKARLPTEAEWEWAARGGLSDKKYVYGDSLEYNQGNFALWWGPRPVGQYPPNGFGLYDMLGNVWEWVNDWYKMTYYHKSPLTDPRGPCPDTREACIGLTDRCMRGGSWFENDPERGLIVAFRNHHAPHTRFRVVGVRCAVDDLPRTGYMLPPEHHKVLKTPILYESERMDYEPWKHRKKKWEKQKQLQ